MNHKPIWEARKPGFVLKVFVDECCEHSNPRDNDNLGTMALFHRRYNLGDRDHGISSESYSSWEEMENDIRRMHDVASILPVYMYDHSGIALSTSCEYPFNDRWDAGQVGFIFASKRKVREWRCIKRITKKVAERVRDILVCEVDEYSKYVNGEVYGFILEDEDGEDIESCWGFIGDDWTMNGLLDNLGREHADLVEALA